jgi:hypothetical protein
MNNRRMSRPKRIRASARHAVERNEIGWPRRPTARFSINPDSSALIRGTEAAAIRRYCGRGAPLRK